jgi:hypothetical protein
MPVYRYILKQHCTKNMVYGHAVIIATFTTFLRD